MECEVPAVDLDLRVDRGAEENIFMRFEGPLVLKMRWVVLFLRGFSFPACSLR